MISDEAVEAAAKAHQGKPVGRMSWDELAPMVRKIRLKKMRAALEAAAPYMLAEAWERGYKESGREFEQAYDIVTPDEDRFVATNPYRSQS